VVPSPSGSHKATRSGRYPLQLDNKKNIPKRSLLSGDTEFKDLEILV
jgi:hypothetical protein